MLNVRSLLATDYPLNATLANIRGSNRFCLGGYRFRGLLALPNRLDTSLLRFCLDESLDGILQ